MIVCNTGYMQFSKVFMCHQGGHEAVICVSGEVNTWPFQTITDLLI